MVYSSQMIKNILGIGILSIIVLVAYNTHRDGQSLFTNPINRPSSSQGETVAPVLDAQTQADHRENPDEREHDLIEKDEETNLSINEGELGTIEREPGKIPSGIFCLLNGDTVENPIPPEKLSTLSVWKDEAVSGIAVRSWWNKIENTEGTYDWKFIDEAVRLAEQHDKQVSISIMSGVSTPAWVYDHNVPIFSFSAPFAGGAIRTMPVPWNTTYLSLFDSFVRKLGDRYDDSDAVTYVYVNGMGPASETYFASAKESDAFEAIGGITAWIDGAEKIIDSYADAFPKTPFVVALASPIPGADGDRAMQSIIDYGIEKYEGAFGITNHGLNALSSTSFLPNKLISTYSDTTPVGFQMVWSTTGTNAQAVRGTLAEALENADELNAHFVEVYLSDCTTPSYRNIIESYNNKFISNAN